MTSTAAINAVLPSVSGASMISGVSQGAEHYGSAQDLAAYQIMNNVAVDPLAIQSIFSSQRYLKEGISYMAEIFGPSGNADDRRQFRLTFGTGPQAAIKVANLLKSSHERWNELTFLMRAGGEIRSEVFDALYAGSGPGGNLARLHGARERAKAELRDDELKQQVVADADSPMLSIGQRVRTQRVPGA